MFKRTDIASDHPLRRLFKKALDFGLRKAKGIISGTD
jgi:hypothetical protein